jgi:hypothetical protein
MKESVEELEGERIFDMASDSRLHVLFAGTKMLQHTAPGDFAGMRKVESANCI